MAKVTAHYLDKLDVEDSDQVRLRQVINSRKPTMHNLLSGFEYVFIPFREVYHSSVSV